MNRGLISSQKQDKIDMNQSKNQMKAIQLSSNIRFLSLSDNEGTFGIFLVHSRDTVYETREVYTKEEFTEVYNELRMKLEQV